MHKIWKMQLMNVFKWQIFHKRASIRGNGDELPCQFKFEYKFSTFVNYFYGLYIRNLEDNDKNCHAFWVVYFLHDDTTGSFKCT